MMEEKNKRVLGELDVIWRKCVRKCLGLAKCCPNQFLEKIVGNIGNWASKMSKKIIVKIKKRIESPY